MAATETLYIKDTLSKDERFVLEYLKLKENGAGISLGGERNRFTFLEGKMKKSSLISHNELLDKLESVGIGYEKAPYEIIDNGHEYDFCLKVPQEKTDYVKGLVEKAGYEIITNGGAKYAGGAGHT